MLKDFRTASSIDPALALLLPQVETLAREAGSILIKYYGKNILPEIKRDGSPVLIADKESSEFLVRELEALHPSFPVVSEENRFDPVTQGITTYWVVDPLDGTKEFIDQTGGFSIKIALIRNNRPVLGVVFCPVQKTLYASLENGPATKTDRSGMIHILSTKPLPETGSLTTLFNRKHADPVEYQRHRKIMADRGIIIPAQPLRKAGLPRNLRVAEGLADLHLGSGFASGPQKGSGYVWDIAADHLILINAGGGLVNLHDGQNPSYETPRVILPGYLAYGDPVLRTKLFPN